MKKRFQSLTLCGLMICILTSCDHIASQRSADEQDATRQEQLQKEATSEVGMPGIHNFTEKKMVRMLYELRDNPNLINYAYLWSEVAGKYVYFGKCVGYGIPYSTQFSNPQKEVYQGGYQESFGSLPQAEPNGLFMPSSSEGTWLMMIGPDNKPVPVYVEPKVIVSPYKLPTQ